MESTAMPVMAHGQLYAHDTLMLASMDRIVVHAAHLRLIDALTRGDAAALRRLLAHDVDYRHADGHHRGRRQVADALLAHGPPPEEWQAAGTLHVLGEEVSIESPTAPTRSRTCVFRRRRGGWRIVAIRDIRLADACAGRQRTEHDDMPATDTASPTAILRLARSDDAALLSALMRRTFVAANGHCSTAENVSHFLDSVYQPQIQAAEIADAGIFTVIAECGGDMAGFAQLRRNTPAPACVVHRPAVELGRIYLEASHHGRGLGSRLLHALVDEARRQGAQSIWLNVWQQAHQAIGFYQRHQFEIVGRSIFTVGDDPKDDWVMARPLMS